MPTKRDIPLEVPITSASFICRPSALTSTIASGSMSPGWISCDTSLTSLFCRNWPKSFPALLTTPIVAGGVRMLAQVAARSSGEKILMPTVDLLPSVADAWGDDEVRVLTQAIDRIVEQETNENAHERRETHTT